MKPTEYIAALGAALDDYRFEEVEPLTDLIDPSAFRPNQAEKTLGLLRRKRRFEELERTACLFRFSGVETPVLGRQWAQALLDQGRVAQALPALRAMKKRVGENATEKSEVQGLIGRAYKQLYVDEGDEAYLTEAIKAYRAGWRAKQGDYRWHGINLAALLVRAEQDGAEPPVRDKVTTIAKRILDEIDGLGSRAKRWDYSTAMEASLALGKEEDAASWLGKYVEDPKVDAFELGSTLRQMKEIWGLEETELGRKVLPVLEGELLKREGAAIEVSERSEPDRTFYELTYGPEGAVELEWFTTMTRRCLAVARVFNTATGTRYGTGFVARGSTLRPDWGDGPVFVTNAHVLSPLEEDEAPLGPDDGSAEFTRAPSRPAVKLGPLLFSSRRTELDCTVLRIQPPDGTEVLEPSFTRPKKRGREQPRIFVIGHPRVGEMKVSLYDNRLVEYAEPYVRYRSPTEPGSSGSPVFTRDWKLFALHHGAKGSKSSNEGVLLGPIRDQATASAGSA